MGAIVTWQGAGTEPCPPLASGPCAAAMVVLPQLGPAVLFSLNLCDLCAAGVSFLPAVTNSSVTFLCLALLCLVAAFRVCPFWFLDYRFFPVHFVPKVVESYTLLDVPVRMLSA